MPALRRAAKADGWIGPPVPLVEVVALHDRLLAERRALGVSDRPFRTIVRLPADADRASVEEYAAAGFGDLAYSPFRSGGLDPRVPAARLQDDLGALAGRLGVAPTVSPPRGSVPATH